MGDFPHNKRIMRANRPRGFVWGAPRRSPKRPSWWRRLVTHFGGTPS